MKKKSKEKIIKITLVIVIITSVFVMMNNYKKNQPLESIKVDEHKIKKEQYAIYKKDVGKEGYEKITETEDFPKEPYVLNLNESYCVDRNENKIDNIITLENNKPKVSSDKTVYCYLYYDERIFRFDYTGGEQTFTVPYDGTYKLETWGAQGGNGNDIYPGGYGAYSIGYIDFTQNDVIYIVIGGKGETALNYNGTAGSGGYNGGGTGGESVINNVNDLLSGGAGGGGATHISLDSGLLMTFKNKITRLIIVSGGGGGGTINGNIGGNGGGISGNPASSHAILGGAVGQGGTQSSGYEFGIGAIGRNGRPPKSSTDGGKSIGDGGAGGGLFGGMESTNYYTCSGSGGSGYIGNTNLTNKHMTCYNCQTSNDEHTKTISNTCVNANPVADCSKTGNGYAKITFIG